MVICEKSIPAALNASSVGANDVSLGVLSKRSVRLVFWINSNAILSEAASRVLVPGWGRLRTLGNDSSLVM